MYRGAKKKKKNKMFKKANMKKSLHIYKYKYVHCSFHGSVMTEKEPYLVGHSFFIIIWFFCFLCSVFGSAMDQSSAYENINSILLY